MLVQHPSGPDPPETAVVQRCWHPAGKTIIFMIQSFPIIKQNITLIYISKVWLINKSDITWGMKLDIFEEFQSRNMP